MMNDTTKKGHRAVFGIFKLRHDVEKAVENLKKRGFRNSDISVLLPDIGNSEGLAHERSTKAPEGSVIGATSGALLGGGLGWLVGIGSLAIPGIGPFVAAGPILALLAGLGMGGTIGGVTGALIGMGLPEYEAKRYEGHIKNGGILLSVHVDDHKWLEMASEILTNAGAIDVSDTSEIKSKEPVVAMGL